MTTPRRRPRAQDRDGFTLVSMIVAIILLTVGILALASANTTTISSQNIAQSRTNAVSIARGYMENVRGRDPWTLEPEAKVTVNAQGELDGSGKYSRELVVETERQNLLRVELVVNYPRGNQPVRLITYQYRGSGINPQNDP